MQMAQEALLTISSKMSPICLVFWKYQLRRGVHILSSSLVQEKVSRSHKHYYRKTRGFYRYELIKRDYKTPIIHVDLRFQKGTNIEESKFKFISLLRFMGDKYLHV